MSESLIIREMNPEELDQVQEVVKAAFYRPDKSQEFNEWHFVKVVMDDPGYVSKLNLVAVLDGRIVGHILFTKASIGGEEGLCLGPIAVDPECQSAGIGSELVKTGLVKAAELNYKWVALLGGDYYLRFGFEPAEKAGIILSENDPANPYLKIRYLTGLHHESVSGVLTFCDSFYDDNGELL